MNTILSRANAILAYYLSVLASIVFLCFLSTFFNEYKTDVKLNVPKVNVKYLTEYSVSKQKKDLGVVSIDINADLNPLFNWNTKQLFLYLVAEYETSDNKLNQIVLWDKIILREENHILNYKNLMTKYYFWDDGAGLRGNKNITLALHWNVIPNAGHLPNVVARGHHTFSFPDHYSIVWREEEYLEFIKHGEEFFKFIKILIVTREECQKQVFKFPNACFKKFSTMSEAKSFIIANQGKRIEKNTFTQLVPKNAVKKQAACKYESTKCSNQSSSHNEVLDNNLTFIDHNGFCIDSENYVHVFIDGACKNNGKKYAIAGVGVWFGDNHSKNISNRVIGKQTNNVAEIQAAIMALRQCQRAGYDRIHIHTDSNFLLQSITSWIKKWKKNGWKSANGLPIKNKEEFEILEKIMTGLTIRWSWVRGHVGNYGNEAADELARQALEC